MDPRLESIDFSTEHGKCWVFGCNNRICANALCELHICKSCNSNVPPSGSCPDHYCFNCRVKMTTSCEVFCDICSHTNPMKYHLKGYFGKWNKAKL